MTARAVDTLRPSRPVDHLADLLGVLAAFAALAIVLPIIGSTYSPAHHAIAAAPLVRTRAHDLKYEDAPGTAKVRFPIGTSAYVAQRAVDALDLTLLESRPDLGLYIFSWPKVTMERVNQHQAQVRFPPHAQRSDTERYLGQHQLTLVRWLPDAQDGWHLALVELPTVAITPQALGDGTYSLVAPPGADLAQLQQQVSDQGLTNLGYDPAARQLTIGEPAPVLPWSAPASVPTPPQVVPVTSKPQTLPVPSRPRSLIYVRSATGKQPDFGRYGATLVSTAQGNLTVVSVDAAAAKAQVQLLSEAPGVTCASITASACAATPVTPPTATDNTSSPAPALTLTVGSGSLVSGTVSLTAAGASSTTPPQVSWTISGPGGQARVSGIARTAAGAAGSWTAMALWDSSQVVDGTYTVTVTTTDGAGRTSTSSTQARIENSAPSPPLELSASTAGRDVHLTWAEPPTARLALLRLSRDGTEVAQLPAGTTAYTDAGAAAAGHTYSLLAVDSAGRMSRPTTASSSPEVSDPTAVAPAPPTIAAVSPAGDAVKPGGMVGGRVLLVSTVPQVGDFHFEFGSSVSQSAWTAVPGSASCTAGRCAQEWDLNPLAVGPYQVRAQLDGLPSSALQLEHVSGSVATPAGLALRPAAGGFGLAWSAASGARAYRVYRVDGTGRRARLTETAATTFVDASPSPGGGAVYTVTALDALGDESGESRPAAADPASAGGRVAVDTGHVQLGAPAQVGALFGAGSIVLTWAAVDGADGYLVERSEGLGSPFVTVGTSAAPIYLDRPDGLGRGLLYQVAPLAGRGVGSTSAPVSTIYLPGLAGSTTQSTTLDLGAGFTPTGVRASVVGTAAHVTWSAAPSTPAGSTFNVYRFDELTGAFSLAATGIAGTAWDDPVLQPQTQYGYAVTATTPGGLESGYSAPSWAVTGVRHLAGQPGDQPSITGPLSAVSEVSQGADVPLSSLVSGQGPVSITFALAPDGGDWTAIDGRTPGLPPALPMGAGLQLAAGMQNWTTVLRTAGMAPGDYRLRATVTDAFGRVSQSLSALRIDAAGARGPPATGLDFAALSEPNAVRLSWSGAEGETYQIDRSLFGPLGPFQPLASTTGSGFEDTALVAGATYSYRLLAIAPGAPTSTSPVVTAVPSSSFVAGSAFSNGVSLRLTDSSLGDSLALEVVSAPLAPALPDGVTANGTPVSVTLRSLVSGLTTGTEAETTLAGAGDSWLWDTLSDQWMLGSQRPGRAFAAELPALFVTGTGTVASAPPATSRQDLPDRRSRYGRTYLNPDGTYTSVLSVDPFNYADQYGQWQAIDNRLVPGTSAGLGWTNAAGGFAAEFEADASTGLIRIDDGSGLYTLGLDGAAPVAATAAGSQVWYTNPQPGIDLGYRVTGSGVKEMVALTSALAPSHLNFHLRGAGVAELSAVAATDGSWSFERPDGTVAFRLDAPFAVDSAQTGPAPLVARHAQLIVRRDESGFAVILAVDTSWLVSGRTYPVLVDPTITLQPSVNATNYDADWAADLPGGSACSSGGSLCTDDAIGTDDSHIWRPSLQFDTSSLAGLSITAASLQLYYNGFCLSTVNPGCPNTSHTVDAHRVTAAWSATGTYSQIQYDSTILSSFTLPASPPDQWMSWDITSTVQNWVSGAQPNDGILLNRDPDSTLNLSGPYPPGMRSTTAGVTPQLVVTYVSDAVNLNTPTSIHSNGADLTWSKYTGPSGAPFSHYTVHRSLSPNFTPSSATQLAAINDISVTSYRDSTAAPNATFYYAIVANSSKSNEVNVTTPADGQATMTLQPSGQDTFIAYFTNLTNCATYGADPGIHVGPDSNTTASNITRGLIFFNLNGIPAGSSVTSATLKLYDTSRPSTGSFTFHAYPVTTAWLPGSGTNANPTCTGDGATWYEATGGVKWTNQGGDYNSSIASSTLTLQGGAGPAVNSMDVTTIVGDWVSGQLGNLGLLLREDNETIGTANADFIFASSEYTGSPALQPALQINYTDGSHAIKPTVSVTAPASGASVIGSTVTLTAAASDDRYVQSLQFYQGSTAIGSPITAAPYSYTWTPPASGTYSFTAVATDDAGNQTTSAAVSATITVPPVPTVSITAPGANASLSGTATVTVSASSSYLSRVELYVDNIRLTTWTGASGSFSYSWNTLDGTVYDGSHTLTAIAYDSYGQSTTSTGVAVSLVNTSGSMYRATITATTTVPAGVVDSGTTPQNTYSVGVQVSNTSSINWSNVYLRYRWISSDPTASSSSDSANLAAFNVQKGRSATYTATVSSPSVGAGLSQAAYSLSFDLWDATNSVFFGQKGNQPLFNPVIVNKALSVALGLERYYQYTQDSVGGGMTHMVNVANGDSILRWTPFTDPGIGLSSMVALTYNSLENHSDSPAGNNWSLSISSITRFGLPIEVHPNNSDTNTTNRWIAMVDADGTYHKFQGNLDSSGNAYYVEPPGVHLYLRQVSTDTSLQGRYWGFTRPDGTTFYYDSLGFPTATVDLNGNTITYTLSPVPTGDPGSHGNYQITAVTDQSGQGTSPAPNRSINLTYFSKADKVKPQVRGNVKSIVDHDGRELDFAYYEDGNLLSITERGGTNADGTPLASRSWVFTYTTSSGAGPAIGSASNGDATRANPDPKTPNESTRLFSVSDPDGHLAGGTYHESTYAYITSGQDKWKLTSYVARDGQQTTFAYNDPTLTTTVTAPLSRTTSYTYDTSGRPTQIVNPLSHSTSFQWSADNELLKLTDANAKSIQYTYDANGQLTDSIDQLGDDTRVGYQNVAVDASDASAHWCPSGGSVNGSPCNPRTIAHISQLHTKTDPLGVAGGSGYQWAFNVQSTTGDLLSVTDPLNETTTYTYSSNGELLTITEPGQTVATTYKAYDANGLPTCVVDPMGDMTQMGYDSAGLVQFVMDANHSGTSGQCTATKDPTRETVYHYDGFGRVNQVSTPKSTLLDPRLIWVDTAYDANDNVVSQVAPHYTAGTVDSTTGADTTSSTYDAMDRLTGVTDPRRNLTSSAYDNAGRLIKTTMPMGQGLTNNTFTVNYVYDAADQLTEITRYHVDSAGASHTLNEFYCYDAVGNRVSDTQPNGGYASVTCSASQSTNNFTTTYAYDAAHRLIGTVDGDSHKNANGYSDFRTYDVDSNLLTETDASGNQTTYTYDQLNRLVRTDQPFMSGHSATTLTKYDQDGNVSLTIGPRAYDASTDKVTFTRFVTTSHYDANHRLTRTDLPYDPSSTDPSQNTEYYVHRAYDGNGNLLWSSQPVTTTDPTQVSASSKTLVQYFDTGWIYTSQDPGQPRVHFDYDASGRQTKRTPENSSGVVDTGKTTTWDYYPGGLLKDIVDQQGQPITYTYNADNLLTATHNASGLTSAVASPVDTQNTYDDLGRLTREEVKKTSDSSWTFNGYAYDSDGNVTDATLNGVESSPGGTVTTSGRTLHYDYDQANWLTDQVDNGIQSSGSDKSKVINTFLANGWAGAREEDSWNGSAFVLKQKTTYDYFGNGLVHDLTTVNAAGTTIESHTVSYLDGSGIYLDGNRTSDVFSKQAPAGTSEPCTTSCTQSWTYDPRDRLIQATDGHGGTYTYTVDPQGNILTESDPGGVSKTYTYTGNQLTTLTNGGVAYKYWYDALGRQQCVTTSAATDSSICSVASGQTASSNLVSVNQYDYQDRLIGFESYSSGALTNQANYSYDALNRTYQETECHSATACTSSTSGQTTTFSYIGMSTQVSQESVTQGTNLASPGATTEVKQYDYDIYGHRLTFTDTPYSGGVAQTSTTYGYGYDEHGSASSLTDPSGNLKATYGYQPYGATDSALTQNTFGSTGDPNPYRYSGKRLDSGTGSYSMGARYFGTDISRFLTPDLFKGAFQNLGLSLNPLSSNRYGLAGGNPTSFVEWDGHMVLYDGGLAQSEDQPYTGPPASSDSGSGSDQWAGGWTGSGVTDTIASRYATSPSTDQSLQDQLPKRCFDPNNLLSFDQGSCTLNKQFVPSHEAQGCAFDLHLFGGMLGACDNLQPYDVGNDPILKGLSQFSNGEEDIDRLLGRASAGKGELEKDAEGEAEEATGQLHHLLSNPIMDALDQHPNLAGVFDRNDPNLIYRAADDAAHRGYQTWHREADAEVVYWLHQNPEADATDFLTKLQSIYDRPDIRARIPGVDLLQRFF